MVEPNDPRILQFLILLQLADSKAKADDKKEQRKEENNERADLNDERIRTTRNIRNAFGDT